MTKLKIPIFIFFITCLAIFLRQVFSGHVILPQLFSFGPLTVHYYGIIMALAVAAGFYFALKRITLYGINKLFAENLLFWVVVGGFFGARIYHIFSSFDYYLNNPADVFKVWNGGLSIYGALLGGLFSIIIFRKLIANRYLLFAILDWLTPSLIVGQIIGRFGNLFNYEAYGYPTNLPWKMFVPEQFRPNEFVSSNFFHPLFLYELAGNLIILFFLLFLNIKYLNRFSGRLFFSYLLLYNSLRFCLEFIRIDSTFIGILNLRLNSISSLFLIIFALIFIFLLSVKNNKCLKDIN